MAAMSPGRIVRVIGVILLGIIFLGASSVPPGDSIQRVRAFTRQVEFDYVSWTLRALGVKLGQFALDTHRYLPPDNRPEVVLEYLDLVAKVQRAEAQLRDIFADPQVADPRQASASLRRELDELYTRRSRLQPLAESILQNQVSQIVAEIGLAYGGQPFPPVLYHSTPPPYALIVSPRDVIRQDADVSVSPELSVDEQVALEVQVDRALDVSSLVVPIGGIGVYPTMVMQTTNLYWLAEVVAHEWIHNYLTLRPLGVHYFTSPELRTVNETAATIAGKEIGHELVARFYPERLPPEPVETPPPTAQEEPSPDVFDFRAEMHETRLEVDWLLAEGKISQAEEYMEMRRRAFWDNGYHIRKINQAYFAFYGAYADQPGGPAGEDPIGEAVRTLRAQSPSLADFVKRISWMWTTAQLERAVSRE